MQQDRRGEALRAIDAARAELRAAAVDEDLIVHAPQLRAWLAELEAWEVEGVGSKRVLAMAREARGLRDQLAGWREGVAAREDQRRRDEAARRVRAARNAPPPAATAEVAERATPQARHSSLPPADARVARRAFDGRDFGPNTAEVRRRAERFAMLSPAEWLVAVERDTPTSRDALEEALVELMARVPEARTWWDAIRAASAPIAAEAAARYAAATGEQPREIEHVRAVNAWDGNREMVRAEPLPPFQERRFRDTLEYALGAVLLRTTDRRDHT